MQAPMTAKVRRRQRRSVHASQLLMVAAEASTGPCQTRPGAEGSGWRSVRKAAMAWTWPGRLERRASMTVGGGGQVAAERSLSRRSRMGTMWEWTKPFFWKKRWDSSLTRSVRRVMRRKSFLAANSLT